MAFVKLMFYTVSVLLSIAATSLIPTGIWYSLQLKDLADLRNFVKIQLDSSIHWPLVLPWIVCIAGILILIVTFCGCLGAGTNNKGVLMIYCVFMFILVVGFMAAAFGLSWVARNENEEFLHNTIWDVFNEAQTKPHVEKKFSELEKYLLCCGAKGYQDHMNLKNRIPESCCSEHDVNCVHSKVNYRNGCIKVASYYSYWAFMFGTVTTSVTAVLGVISLALACTLMFRMNGKEKEIS